MGDIPVISPEMLRQMIRRHGQRLSNILECQLLGEMRADVLPDTVRQHQIMRLIGGTRIRRQIGRQQHQRPAAAVRRFHPSRTFSVPRRRKSFAERLHVVNLIHRRTHKSVFCLGEMPFPAVRTAADRKCQSRTYRSRVAGRGDFMQIALII